MCGIGALEAEIIFMLRIIEWVRELVAAKLRGGMAGLNQADIGGSLNQRMQTAATSAVLCWTIANRTR
jgi:hypothetical protein